MFPGEPREQGPGLPGLPLLTGLASSANGGLPGPGVEPRDVGTPCRDGVDQSFLAQGSDGAPGCGPRDLIRLDKLSLGGDAGVRREMARQDPALDDRRYLPVGRHRAERVDPLSWHMINFRYRSP